MESNFESTFEYKLIYIFRINDAQHQGCVKVGDATIHTSKNYTELFPNCHDLNYAARQRIDSYTGTAGIVYELLHTEIAVYKCNDKHSKKYGKTLAFRDYNVHSVLTRSGILKKHFNTNQIQNEWFKCDLETAKKAITAVKNNQKALNNRDVTHDRNPIIFRPEQEEAIKKTVGRYKNHDRMLWNAKMRFGKTLTALEVAKQMKFNRTIIVTHRPVVSDGWFEDFHKIFYEPDTKYEFGSKTLGKSLENLIKSNCPFVYFASIQDLRGSDIVGGNFNKNDKVFKTLWDFVVVDEAHEGTQTELGKAVLKELVKNTKDHKTHILELSGTPFNLLSDFEADEIYTWDYIMEQEAKNNWFVNHFGDSNPYDELPKLNIFTYHLEKSMPAYIDAEDKAFNFREFFRTWTGDITKDFKHIPEGCSIGDFVHEDDINAFLDLLCKKDDENNYPFSTKEYQDFFRHSLWIVPGVKEAKALSKLMKAHHVFGNNEFKIVNVAGDGDEEIVAKDALQLLRDNIGDEPENTRTITLSCGRLTTGVTVPEWTAVFMLAGTYSTAASQYLQTIFRVQSPANINGRIKENCFVFDFAPDRTLKMVAESVHLSSRAGAGNKNASIALAKFLNYCPVIAVEGSSMKEFTVDQMLRELKKAYSERVARNGFDDPKIYNDELLKLTDVELKDFEELKKIVGSSKQTKGQTEIDINNEGFNDEELEEIEKIKKKPRKELTEEEKKRLAELKEKRKNRDSAISILRAISIRMPLIVYGADTDVDESITIDKFTDLVDDLSWAEFMPKDVTKEMFKKFSKYYDKDIFIGAALRIRAISRTADELEPTERVKKIASLFATFKNPDKETVLTPWRAVNMHLGSTIGGYNFYDDKYENLLNDPRLIIKDKVTERIFNDEGKILEINSKSGLYPLYVAYTLYRFTIDKINSDDLTFEKKIKIWDEVVRNKVFVVCKTPMAKLITRRTLVGYRDVKANTRYFEDLLNQLKQESKCETFLRKMHQGKSYWKATEDNNMKFNAVVGNPPYQGENHQQIYPDFYLTSIKIGDFVSMIFPTGWQEPKSANNLAKMNTDTVKKDKQIMLIDNRDGVFPGIQGADHVNFVLWQKGYDNKLGGKQLVYNNGENPEEIELLINKADIAKPEQIIKLNNIVNSNGIKKSLQDITSSRNPYGLPTNIIKDYEKLNLYNEKKDSNDIVIYAKSGLILYANNNYKFKKICKGFGKYKVLIPYAWGNMDEKTYLGGAFSDLILAHPNEACTETYLESGCFNDKDTAIKYAKYLLTKFARALLYVNKYSQHSTTSFGAIPIQDFSESWWDESVESINEHLFEKYRVPKEIREYVNKNIQPKNISNLYEFK